MLVSLLNRPMFISQLIRRYDNPGISSQPALEKTRIVLTNLNLVEEYEKYIELTGKTRLYLRLTDKGREVAEKLRKIATTLSES